jgi:uncharacterized membrane protein (DUF4010 family)
MNESSLFFRFGVSLVIGILVGLQREFASDTHDRELAAGVRTFGLVGLAGCSAAYVSDLLHSPWPLVGVILTLGVFFAINYFIDASHGKPGLTTKASLILTLLSGSIAYFNHVALAVALAVSVTVLLSVKIQLHRFVRHLTREDIYAALKFAVITAIVLPLLPNRVFGPPPFDIFNPLTLWLFVVFISGIGFVGYVLVKLEGAQKGIGLTGFLGGLTSSTAVTVSLTQRSRENMELSRSFALAIIIAWTVMFVRVIAVVSVLNVAVVRPMLVPLCASIVVGLAYCLYLSRTRQAHSRQHDVAFANPFELGLAVKFGLLFALILLFSRTMQVYFGTSAVYFSGFLSGMADVDAVAFSMAKLSRGAAAIDSTIAARAIVLAAVANTLVKGIIVFAGGAPALKRAILPGYLAILLAGVSLAFLM